MVDATPLNLRLPDLPHLIRSLYGEEERAKLRFIIMLREPVARLQSGFYFGKNVMRRFGGPNHTLEYYEESFPAYVNMTERRVPEFESDLQAGAERLSRDFPLDQFYRSMYSLNLKPWLEVFAPRQFVIIPSSLYFRDLASRGAVMNQVAEFLRLDPALLGAVGMTKKNVGKHPRLEDDITPEKAEWLRREYFTPDTRRLAEMLAPRFKDGLVVAGYDGGPDAPAIQKYLTDHW